MKYDLNKKSTLDLEQLIKFVLGEPVDFEEARKLLRAADDILVKKGGRKFKGNLSYSEILKIRTISEIYFNYSEIEAEFASTIERI